jgi:hypothetical protein
VLFVTYEICLALALGYAATRHQAIEVGMVNYLWPSLTICLLFCLMVKKQPGGDPWINYRIDWGLLGIGW